MHRRLLMSIFQDLQKKYKNTSIRGVNLENGENSQFLPLLQQPSLIMWSYEYEKGSEEIDRLPQPERREARRSLVERLNEEYPNSNYKSNDKAKFSADLEVLIGKIDGTFENFLENEIPSTPLEIVDNKANASAGRLVHRASATTLDELRTFADCGVVASEYFGHIESGSEGRLCCFLDRKRSPDYVRYRMNLPDADGKIYFYFDENNPVMQKLLKFDFFKYIRMKETEPDNIKETFPIEAIELFEKVIGPLSPNARGNICIMGGDVAEEWIAIPGGVPPYLINGLQIHTENPISKHLDEIAEMFPYATIFDENNNVLRVAEITKMHETESGLT